MLGWFLGGVVGFVAGAALAGGFAWLLHLVLTEEALDPLADLKIEQEALTPDEKKTYVDQLAREYLDADGNVGLVIGIIEDGEKQVFGYGSVSNATRQTPDENTVFELASVGKTFTATLLADMHVRGEVDWNTPVADLLPEQARVPQAGALRISLLDLATQTSGLPSLPDNFNPGDPLNPYADYTIDDMYRGLAAMTLPIPPGKKYAYSNLGFGLLGHALALQAGADYEDLVVERICTPIGMNSTRMTLDESLRSRLAVPHDGGSPVKVWEDRTMAGAGSFLSTAADMLRYIEAHFPGADHPLHSAMQATIGKRRPADNPATAIGLGWHITSENAIDIIWHNGGSGGSRSYAAFLPEQQTGVVVLSNSSSSVDELGRKVLYLLHLY